MPLPVPILHKVPRAGNIGTGDIMFIDLIRDIVFDEKIRAGLTFSDSTKVRLNSFQRIYPVIQLTADETSGEYSTDSDLFIETPMFTPNALKRWLAFEAIVVEDPLTFILPAGASLGFKVKTTAGNYWWNGTAWAVAGASEWSTESQINDNFSTFPIVTIGNKSIGFVVNLKTTDAKVTPQVLELKMLGEYDIEFFDDLVYDGVIRTLNTLFRSSSVLRFRASGSSSIDLDTVLVNKGYNITGIRTVYDLTADPLKLDNLFDSYVQGAPKKDGFTHEPGTVNFTSAITSDHWVDIQFEFVPEIFIRTGQDYYEVPAYPSVVFEAIDDITDSFTMQANNSNGQDLIRDKAAKTAIEQIGPRQSSIRFRYAVYTDRQVDQMRLLNDINKFWANNAAISTHGMDCQYGVTVVERLNTARNQSSADTTDTNAATGAFVVLGVLFYDKTASAANLVGPGQLNVNLKPVD